MAHWTVATGRSSRARARHGLIKALDGKDIGRTASAAAAFLGRLGDPRAVEPFIAPSVTCRHPCASVPPRRSVETAVPPPSSAVTRSITAGISRVVAFAGRPSELEELLRRPATIRWQDAHRPESPTEAVAVDDWLADAWGSRPCFRRIDNGSRDWAAKSLAARAALAELALGWLGNTTPSRPSIEPG